MALLPLYDWKPAHTTPMGIPGAQSSAWVTALHAAPHDSGLLLSVGMACAAEACVPLPGHEALPAVPPHVWVSLWDVQPIARSAAGVCAADLEVVPAIMAGASCIARTSLDPASARDAKPSFTAWGAQRARLVFTKLQIQPSSASSSSLGHVQVLALGRQFHGSSSPHMAGSCMCVVLHAVLPSSSTAAGAGAGAGAGAAAGSAAGAPGPDSAGSLQALVPTTNWDYMSLARRSLHEIVTDVHWDARGRLYFATSRGRLLVAWRASVLQEFRLPRPPALGLSTSWQSYPLLTVTAGVLGSGKTAVVAGGAAGAGMVLLTSTKPSASAMQMHRSAAVLHGFGGDKPAARCVGPDGTESAEEADIYAKGDMAAALRSHYAGRRTAALASDELPHLLELQAAFTLSCDGRAENIVHLRMPLLAARQQDMAATLHLGATRRSSAPPAEPGALGDPSLLVNKVLVAHELAPWVSVGAVPACILASSLAQAVSSPLPDDAAEWWPTIVQCASGPATQLSAVCVPAQRFQRAVKRAANVLPPEAKQRALQWQDDPLRAEPLRAAQAAFGRMDLACTVSQHGEAVWLEPVWRRRTQAHSATGLYSSYDESGDNPAMLLAVNSADASLAVWSPGLARMACTWLPRSQTPTGPAAVRPGGTMAAVQHADGLQVWTVQADTTADVYVQSLSAGLQQQKQAIEQALSGAAGTAQSASRTAVAPARLSAPEMRWKLESIATVACTQGSAVQWSPGGTVLAVAHRAGVGLLVPCCDAVADAGQARPGPLVEGQLRISGQVLQLAALKARGAPIAHIAWLPHGQLLGVDANQQLLLWHAQGIIEQARMGPLACLASAPLPVLTARWHSAWLQQHLLSQRMTRAHSAALLPLRFTARPGEGPLAAARYEAQVLASVTAHEAALQLAAAGADVSSDRACHVVLCLQWQAEQVQASRLEHLPPGLPVSTDMGLQGSAVPACHSYTDPEHVATAWRLAIGLPTGSRVLQPAPSLLEPHASADSAGSFTLAFSHASALQRAGCADSRLANARIDQPLQLDLPPAALHTPEGWCVAQAGALHAQRTAPGKPTGANLRAKKLRGAANARWQLARGLLNASATQALASQVQLASKLQKRALAAAQAWDTNQYAVARVPGSVWAGMQLAMHQVATVSLELVGMTSRDWQGVLAHASEQAVAQCESLVQRTERAEAQLARERAAAAEAAAAHAAELARVQAAHTKELYEAVNGYEQRLGAVRGAARRAESSMLSSAERKAEEHQHAQEVVHAEHDTERDVLNQKLAAALAEVEAAHKQRDAALASVNAELAAAEMESDMLVTAIAAQLDAAQTKAAQAAVASRGQAAMLRGSLATARLAAQRAKELAGTHHKQAMAAQATVAALASKLDRMLGEDERLRQTLKQREESLEEAEQSQANLQRDRRALLEEATALRAAVQPAEAAVASLQSALSGVVQEATLAAADERARNTQAMHRAQHDATQALADTKQAKARAAREARHVDVLHHAISELLAVPPESRAQWQAAVVRLRDLSTSAVQARGQQGLGSAHLRSRAQAKSTTDVSVMLTADDAFTAQRAVMERSMATLERQRDSVAHAARQREAGLAASNAALLAEVSELRHANHSLRLSASLPSLQGRSNAAQLRSPAGMRLDAATTRGTPAKPRAARPARARLP